MESTLFSPIRRGFKKKKLAAFDVETHSRKNDFLCGSIVTGLKSHFFTNRKEMREFLLSPEFVDTWMVSTNLNFDICALYPARFIIEKMNLIDANGRFIFLSYDENDKNHPVNFMDSLNVMPVGVAGLGKFVNMEKKKPEWLGRKPENDKEWEELRNYNITDAAITLKAVSAFQDYVNSQGGELKVTIAATAMNMFRRKFLARSFIPTNREANALIRKGYYGGRTEAFARGSFEKLRAYDINSLYPVSMLNNYPDADHLKKDFGKPDIYGKEGFAKIKACNVEGYLPPLPFRHEKKLIFPCGSFAGTYPYPFLRYLSNRGIKYCINESWSCPSIHSPFKKYVDFHYEKRANSRKTKDDFKNFIHKLFMNSLYGKFAQHLEKNVYLCNVLPEEDDFVLPHSDIIRRTIESEIPAFHLPLWSAYTTCYAQLILLSHFEKIKNPENVYYCDTDSIHTSEKLACGNGLGGLKLEYEGPAVIIKPKFYEWTDKRWTDKLGNEKTGYIKCKGIPKLVMNPNEKNTIAGNFSASKFTFEKFVKFKEGLTRRLKINSIIETSKTLDLNDTKRLWPSKKKSFRDFEKKFETSKPLRFF